MTDKMREEFEAKLSCWGYSFSRAQDGAYLDQTVERYWWVWSSSRAALVVELPPPYPAPEEPDDAIDDSWMDAHHAATGMRFACKSAIESIGVKVKP